MKKFVAGVALLAALGAVIITGISLSAAAENLNYDYPSSTASEARSNFDLNSGTTENVYQQMVVAGWGTMDMTEVAVDELSAIRSATHNLMTLQSNTSMLLSVMIFLLAVLTAMMAFNQLGGASNKKVDSSPVLAEPTTNALEQS